MTYRKGSIWDEPEVIAELEGLAGTAMSASLIADALSAKFDHYFSRNTVIGKMRRLGITTGNAPSRSRYPVGGQRKPKAKARPEQPRWLIHPSRRKFGQPRPAKPAKVIDPVTRVSIFDHRDGQCRWPVTEVQPIGEFRYCGGTVMDKDCPYCAPHWRMSRTSYRSAEAA